MLPERYRAWAEIDRAALRHNFRLLRERSGTKVMCVIKGDAHGHGAAECGRILEQEGAAAFAVACAEEGISLRKAGITRPILILGWSMPDCVPELLRYDLSQSVTDADYAELLNAAAAQAGGTLTVHIKLDTGMSRTGIPAQSEPAAAAREVLRIAQLPHLDAVGLFTHFAAADMPEKDGFTAWQLENYRRVLRELDGLGFRRPLLRHLCNSAGILYHPEAYFDMVRAGVLLYGLSPTNERTADSPFLPVLTLKARVAQVRELPAGAHVSYGCTFEAEAPMTVAAVTAGYADGYPRALSNRGAYAVIRGQKCRQIGRICMDMCMFDVTGTDARVGDEVILYGAGGMPLEALTTLSGTIDCEPTCILTQRVRKVYIG